MSETTLIQRLGRFLSWVCYGVAALLAAFVILALSWNDDRTAVALMYAVPPALVALLLGRGFRYVLSNE